MVDIDCEYKGNLVVLNDEYCSCLLTNDFMKLPHQGDKFYKMQVIEFEGKYILFIKYGRYNSVKVINYKNFNSKNDAIKDFKNQFKKKTGNKWENANNFIHQIGKYKLA